MATAPIAGRDLTAAAADVIRRCRTLAQYTEEPGVTTRRFLTPPMRQVHADLTRWMQAAGMQVSVDPAGNLRGVRPERASSPRFYIGSHLDTVPHAGAFDGILGVVAAVSLVELLGDAPLPFGIEVIGFSEEEGARFGVPFIGSRAFTGTLSAEILARRDADAISVGDAIRNFGLVPEQLPSALAQEAACGWLELHIEQGPVLDGLGLPVAVVDAIAGQTRLELAFSGATNHAGTTPMTGRRDALAGAAEWIVAVERHGASEPGLVATVGHIAVQPGSVNAIAGRCVTSLDIRHTDDAARRHACEMLVSEARLIAARRRLDLSVDVRVDQAAVPMDPRLSHRLAAAIEACGLPQHRMASGAGHDAMIVAARMPAAMLFVRSPGGLSHHPDEIVLEADVAAALNVTLRFLEALAC